LLLPLTFFRESCCEALDLPMGTCSLGSNLALAPTHTLVFADRQSQFPSSKSELWLRFVFLVWLGFGIMGRNHESRIHNNERARERDGTDVEVNHPNSRKSHSPWDQLSPRNRMACALV